MHKIIWNICSNTNLYFLFKRLSYIFYHFVGNVKYFNSKLSSNRYGIDKKGMTFDHYFGYSFPLLSSHVKKEGRRKGDRMNKKSRDQKSCLSDRSRYWTYYFFNIFLKYFLKSMYYIYFAVILCDKKVSWAENRPCLMIIEDFLLCFYHTKKEKRKIEYNFLTKNNYKFWRTYLLWINIFLL